jgi:hypothetical protein
MSNPSSREKVLKLVEQVWGSRSPDLEEWVDRDKTDLKLGFEHDPETHGMDEQEEFLIALEAATRLVLTHWDNSGVDEKKKAARVLSVATERLDEDQFLLEP